MSKKAYTKKEAVYQIKNLLVNSSIKNPPTRVYEDDGKWYLTSNPGRRINTLRNMINVIIKDSISRKANDYESKSQMEEEVRLRNFILKQLKVYDAKNKDSIRKD